jgi:putative phage-type endonuclease
MLSARDHELRSRGLGSSDVSAVVGENPYKTAHDVYLEKRGLVERSEGSAATWLGHELEPIIAKRYALETGVALRPGPGTMRHHEHEWVLASTDYEYIDGARIVECKYVGGSVMSHWTRDVDGIPPYVHMQAQWQMFARSIPRCDVIVLFGATAEFRIYELEVDEGIMAPLLTIARRFWFDHVLTAEPPPVDHTENAKRMLRTLYPISRKPLKPAPIECNEWFNRRLAAEPELERWQREYDLANNKLREAIGDAEGITGDFGIVTNKADKRGRRSLRVYPRRAS